MKAIAYHIRLRFFISKSDVRQSATFDPAQPKSADFPDRDFLGVRQGLVCHAILFRV
jgi:hypothetical protein